jgi:single-strand DNA-binding protein
MTLSCGSPQPDSRSPGSASRQRPRYRDNATGEWKDGDTLFLTCQAWRQAAENVAESLQRGMRAIVTCRLRQRSYETKDGEKRTVYELQVDEAGPVAPQRHRQSHQDHPAPATASPRTPARPPAATATSRRSDGFTRPVEGPFRLGSRGGLSPGTGRRRRLGLGPPPGLRIVLRPGRTRQATRKPKKLSKSETFFTGSLDRTRRAKGLAAVGMRPSSGQGLTAPPQ